MNVLIIGSGRVGSAIAVDLAARGHDITVIDRDPDSLIRLGTDFSGRFEVGEGFDSELLERGGVVTADALLACTDDDNTNIVIAQIAQRRYNVEKVVIRIFDPKKAEFYSGKGLRVVCPTIRAIGEMVGAIDSGSDIAERVTAEDESAQALSALSE